MHYTCKQCMEFRLVFAHCILHMDTVSKASVCVCSRGDYDLFLKEEKSVIGSVEEKSVVAKN